MGLTYLDVVVRNPVDSGKEWKDRFLVDTGAYDCMVPAKRLENLGLVPFGTREYKLADGRLARLPAGLAELEILEEIVGVTMVFGLDDAKPVLDAMPLASAGIDPSSQTRELKKRRAVSLKLCATN